MKKIAVLIEELFDEQELIYPYYRLLEDFEVDLVGAEKDKEYTSKAGFKKKSTVASKDVSADDYAAVYIPGGFSPDYMRRTEATVKLVTDMFNQGKPVAAICHAGWMLASSCDLKGKQVTSTGSIKDDLIHAGADWVNREVVVSDNIISSRGPSDMPALMRELLKMIEG